MEKSKAISFETKLAERRRANLELFKKRVEEQPNEKRAGLALLLLPSILLEDKNIIDMETLSRYGVDCRDVKEKIRHLLVCHFAGMCELNENVLSGYSFSAREIDAAKLSGIKHMIKEGFPNETVLSRVRKMGFRELQMNHAARRLVNEAISKRKLYLAIDVAERYGIRLDVKIVG